VTKRESDGVRFKKMLDEKTKELLGNKQMKEKRQL